MNLKLEQNVCLDIQAKVEGLSNISRDVYANADAARIDTEAVLVYGFGVKRSLRKGAM